MAAWKFPGKHSLTMKRHCDIDIGKGFMVSTTAAQSETDVTTYEAARAQLLGWGALMAVIYVVFLIVFPLMPAIYQADHVLEIEQMLRHGREWFALFYVLGLLMLFYAFWRVLTIVHSFSREDPEAGKSLRIWVLGIGVLCGIVLIGLYPITALDVVLYVVRARLWALYGGSPMLALPASFPQDPYIQFAGEYQKEVSPYGPLWELVAQLPIRIGILNIAGGVIAMKLISLLSYVGMAVLVGWYGRQDRSQLGVSALTAMTFFALNPMVLMQAIGNGHNDMLMLALMTLGLVLWQRDRWAWAALALTLATLVKITGLILMPLFGIAVLAAAPNWQARIVRCLGVAAIFFIIAGITYRLTGPFPEVFEGARHVAFDRAGYTLSYALQRITYEIYPNQRQVRVGITYGTRLIFILYYAYLLVRLAQHKMTLIQAGFLAYFSQLILGATFRIWYPLWLIPFAALGLNSSTYWRTFLLSLTAELSILMYLILWRWKLDSWDWGINGPLKPYWHYWTIMTLLTVPWLFGLPLLGPLLRKWKDSQRFNNSLWI
jgi:hypothetical protein